MSFEKIVINVIVSNVLIVFFDAYTEKNLFHDTVKLLSLWSTIKI